MLRPEGVFLCVSRKFAGCRIFRLVLRFDGVNYSSSSRGRMRSRRPLKYRPLDANGHLLKWWVGIRSREPFEMRCFSGDALPKHVATFSQTTGSAMMKHTLADHRVRELPFSLAPASIPQALFRARCILEPRILPTDAAPDARMHMFEHEGLQWATNVIPMREYAPRGLPPEGRNPLFFRERVCVMPSR